MLKVSADIVYTNRELPIDNGIVIINKDNTILDVIDPSKIDYQIEDIAKYSGIISPAFVNCHSHLELAYLKGKMQKEKGLGRFISQMRAYNTSIKEEEEQIDAMIKADKKMFDNGISLCGDISNTATSFGIKNKSSITYHTFIEALGIDDNNAKNRIEYAENLYNKCNTETKSIVPHSAYSVSDRLMHWIISLHKNKKNVFSIHSLESNAENDFVKNAKGEIIEAMVDAGLDIETVKPKGIDAFEYICSLSKNIISNKLFVHNTFISQKDIDLIRKYNLTDCFFCVCPNSNLYIEKSMPDIQLLINNNLDIIVGTDSYASNSSLSILEEIKQIKYCFKSVADKQLIEWATINGAKAFGLNYLFGTLQPNTAPGIVNIYNDNKDAFRGISLESKVRRIC